MLFPEREEGGFGDSATAQPAPAATDHGSWIIDECYSAGVAAVAGAHHAIAMLGTLLLYLSSLYLYIFISSYLHCFIALLFFIVLY